MGSFQNMKLNMYLKLTALVSDSDLQSWMHVLLTCHKNQWQKYVNLKVTLGPTSFVSKVFCLGVLFSKI